MNGRGFALDRSLRLVGEGLGRAQAQFGVRRFQGGADRSFGFVAADAFEGFDVAPILDAMCEQQTFDVVAFARRGVFIGGEVVAVAVVPLLVGDVHAGGETLDGVAHSRTGSTVMTSGTSATITASAAGQPDCSH